MRLKLIFAIVFTLTFVQSNVLMAQTRQLSENSKIMLFTCGPGDELYAGFGHSALWISDPENKIDRLYNYGTFDFDTPNFYVKFTRGRLDYMLSVSTLDRFLREYDYRKISVYGQLLNLTQLEKQRFYDFLENNAKPENRFYRYDFFYDNCATRFRDVLNVIADGEVRYNIPDEHTSLRSLLFPYLKHTPWTSTGINIVLGLPADKIAAPEEYMYLPEYLKVGFENATITKAGETRKLVLAGREYLPNRLSFEKKSIFGPITVFSLLYIVILFLSIIERKKGKYYKWLDRILMSISILVGVFLFLLWVATDHTTLNNNLNCFWLIPSQAYFLYVISKWCKTKKTGALIALGYTVVIIIAQQFWIQATESSFIILNLIFGFRYLVGYLRWSK